MILYSYIFLQLCTGGDLFTYISSRHNNEGLVEGEAKYIMYQLLQGLKYLHDRMISHRGISFDADSFCPRYSYCGSDMKAVEFSAFVLSLSGIRL
jgi:serine/threonine protein kinase